MFPQLCAKAAPTFVKVGLVMQCPKWSFVDWEVICNQSSSAAASHWAGATEALCRRSTDQKQCT
eukprot:3223432-Amphidinium_carterae.1